MAESAQSDESELTRARTDAVFYKYQYETYYWMWQKSLAAVTDMRWQVECEQRYAAHLEGNLRNERMRSLELQKELATARELIADLAAMLPP